MKKRYVLNLVGILVFTIGIFGNPFVAFGQETKSDVPGNITASSAKMNEAELREKIQTYGKEHNVKPIDATVNRVWKAIPGYNGLEVDEQASFNKMKKAGKFDPNKVVFKEVAPKVHLKDLGAEPIYRGNPKKPMVALLINVAWGNEYIPKILQILKENDVKATFFFDGSWVKKNPDLAKKISDAGHEIGNHAYSHPDLNQKGKAETMQELKKTNEVIKKTIGKTPKWFAPPSGSFNQTTVNVANQLGMKTILWTADTVDWKKPSTTEMLNRVMPKVENGTMILMHPTQPVAEGLKHIISGVKAKGYKLGTVSDLMSEKRIWDKGTGTLSQSE